MASTQSIPGMRVERNEDRTINREQLDKQTSSALSEALASINAQAKLVNYDRPPALKRIGLRRSHRSRKEVVRYIDHLVDFEVAPDGVNRILLLESYSVRYVTSTDSVQWYSGTHMISYQNSSGSWQCTVWDIMWLRRAKVLLGQKRSLVLGAVLEILDFEEVKAVLLRIGGQTN